MRQWNYIRLEQRGLQTLNNIPITHTSQMLSFWMFDQYNFFTYPFNVKNVYTCRLVKNLSSKAAVGLYGVIHTWIEIKGISSQVRTFVSECKKIIKIITYTHNIDDHWNQEEEWMIQDRQHSCWEIDISFTIVFVVQSCYAATSNELQCSKRYLLTCATSKISHQPAHLHNLIRVYDVHVKKLCILGYSKWAQRRFWSDCAHVRSFIFFLLSLKYLHRERKIASMYVGCDIFLVKRQGISEITDYNKTSMTRISMARFPWLIRTRFWAPRKLFL